MGQLIITLSNISQGSLPSNTEDPRREGKENCKIINLKFGKDVHILVGIPKRRVEPISIQKETQVEEEPQPFTLQHTGENSKATTSTKNNYPIPIDEDAATPT